MDVTEAVCRALNIFFGISGCEDSWCYPYVKLQGESICLKSKQPVSFERSAVVSAAKRIPDGSLPGGELEREVVLRIPVDEDADESVVSRVKHQLNKHCIKFEDILKTKTRKG